MKKILIYRWKAYNYDDVIAAFQKLGFETKIIRQNLDNYDVNDEFAELLRNEIKKDTYDFVFTINYFPVISDVCEELSIPYVSYSCDAPLISMYHESVFNDVNRIFLFDADSVGKFRALGVGNVEYIPLGVDHERLDRQLSMPSPFDRQMTDLLHGSLTFVGSLYEKNSYDRISRDLPDYLKGYFSCAMQLEASKFGTEHIFDDIMTSDIAEQLMEIFSFSKSDRSFSTLPFVFETTSLGFKTAQIQRKRELIELSKTQRVCAFTESDTDDIFSVKNMGGVDYRVMMPWAFKESAINLNFTIPNIHTGIPLRVWDVLGAGGFLLTNHQSEMDFIFHDGEDMAWFDCEEELIDKASYYMTHTSEREKIAKKGAALVRDGHSFVDRIKMLIGKL
ncbi:MAG: DUF3880 domain-containing protein [Lachnospiraceae bacterium]|nr:DUF3880 domain-containing protein [Lachnospiraceae bacterium]